MRMFQHPCRGASLYHAIPEVLPPATFRQPSGLAIFRIGSSGFTYRTEVYLDRTKCSSIPRPRPQRSGGRLSPASALLLASASAKKRCGPPFAPGEVESVVSLLSIQASSRPAARGKFAIGIQRHFFHHIGSNDWTATRNLPSHPHSSRSKTRNSRGPTKHRSHGLA